MGFIFSSKNKYTTWRKLWLALAKSQKQLGLPITDTQIKQMSDHIDTLNLDKVAHYEKKLRHDVMAHIHAFADQCPDAKGIIHLGATSAYVTDNTDLIQIQQALQLLMAKVVYLLQVVRDKSEQTASIATLAYTHLQPAQPTTVGKRLCLWLQDFLIDLQEIKHRLDHLCFLGLKGATGTQASFMKLLDKDKVKKLDQLVAKEMGFTHLFLISGQTYTRKQDHLILSTLAYLGASAHKCATDLRLLAHFGEMGEKKEKEQVGSSAMPHKQNPILAERTCALARFLISLSENPAYTHATQWLERSLDDSANRRIVIPEAFLTADAILNLLIHIFSHLQLNEAVITKNLSQEQDQLALENILMCAVSKGHDRQQVHEKLRTNPQKGREIAKELGLGPDEITICFQPHTGRAEDQVKEFLAQEVDPLLNKYSHLKAPLHTVTI